MTGEIASCKKCARCQQVFLFSNFPRNRTRPDGYGYWCKGCVRETSRENLVDRILKGARNRAAKLEVPFDLTRETILALNAEQCGKCAISGKPLNWIEMPRRPQSQRVCPPDRVSLDRIHPSQGYVKGNVQLVTDLANRIKGDSSMATLIDFCQAILSHQRSLQ